MSARVIEALNGYGCDTATAMSRFLNNEDMYVRFLGKFLEDPSFAQIKPAMDAGDMTEMFSAVHTVKGVAGNLGFSPLYDIAAYMVDEYRAGHIDVFLDKYPELERRYTDVRGILEMEIR